MRPDVGKALADLAAPWREHAACRGMDPNIFHPIYLRPSERRPGSVLAYNKAVAEAKAICANCEVRQECLAWAITVDDVGILGGKTAKERGEIRDNDPQREVEAERRRRAIPQDWCGQSESSWRRGCRCPECERAKDTGRMVRLRERRQAMIDPERQRLKLPQDFCLQSASSYAYGCRCPGCWGAKKAALDRQAVNRAQKAALARSAS